VPDNRQRVIVFVAGGMTYSEMREVYKLSGSLQKDIYIGMPRVSSSCTVKNFFLKVRRMLLHLRALSTILKFLSLGGLDPNRYPTDFVT